MKEKRFEMAGLQCIEIAPEGENDALPLVVGLHGWGDWGEGLVDLAPLISETAFRYVFPTGPESVPGAQAGWFPVRDFENFTTYAAQGRPALINLLDALLSHYRLSPRQLFLFGFSQGGMMTLDAGLRYRNAQGQPLAGLACLSGLLIGEPALSSQTSSNPTQNYGAAQDDLTAVLAGAARAKIPVLVAHGSYDPVVPVRAGQATRAALEKAGLAVQYYEFAGAHQITAAEMGVLQAFIAKAFQNFSTPLS